jgi:hypothetical protein
VAILLVMPQPEDVVVIPIDLVAHLSVAELTSGDWFRVEWPDSPFPVVMRLGRSADGQVVCSGLLLGGARKGQQNVGIQRGRLGAEISASSLRQIPLGLLLDALSHRQSFFLERLPEFQRPTRLGPLGIPPERLATVADLYQRALQERPSAPVQWMREQYPTPEGKPTPAPTIRRWLQRCRDLGLLGPSIPGKAGEQPQKQRRRKQR